VTQEERGTRNKLNMVQQTQHGSIVFNMVQHGSTWFNKLNKLNKLYMIQHGSTWFNKLNKPWFNKLTNSTNSTTEKGIFLQYESRR